ncbi:hypothetical protein GWI33_021384 [Rhynchophorus ferrugineus]|uniref:Uracil-DNA glycosylase-like domain-containing protein n=1 Tax=Rhynchophorus ferrugineus TaxID=354439 RepID=A0A834HSP2_RHYFE|nr:hypothetical protein GWI33_021384 [Rhynchophorus ferrugineus]
MLRNKLLNIKSDETKECFYFGGESTSFDDPPNVSEYFSNANSTNSKSVCAEIVEIQRSLSQKLKGMNFLSSRIKYVYDPTDYASEPSEKYIEEYCQDTKEVLFVGMNPGPFGMCQTGVPFGDTKWVKNWLGIEGKVDKPLPECPARPVEGFKCTKKEQSGHRFWSLFSELCHIPEKFFKHAFLYNYCPLAFMDNNGRNITPADEKNKDLESVCDQYFLKIINVLKPQMIVGIGRYVEKRIGAIIKTVEVKPQNHDLLKYFK